MSPGIRYRIRDGVRRALVAVQDGEIEILQKFAGRAGKNSMFGWFHSLT